MPDRDRPAVDVVLLGINPEFLAAVQRLYGKGLVELPEVDVVDAETVSLKQAGDRPYRPDSHLVGLEARH